MAYTRVTGEYLDFLYNRDYSSKNYYLSGTFTPDYGSSISWENRIAEVKFSDYYSKRKPLGLNSMESKFSLNFVNINKFEAGILNKTMEEINKSESPYITLTYDDNQIVSSGINNVYINLDYGNNSDRLFNNISGCSLSNYSIKSKENNLYEFTLDLINDSYPAYFYTDGFYTNSNVNTWEAGQSYEKYDIIKMNLFQNERDNIFYCTEDHTSSAANSPSQNSQYWTQDFFWEPNFSINVGHERQNFQKSPVGFYEKINKYKNENFSNFQIKFENISNKETRSIIHFLENRMGYKGFVFNFNFTSRSKKIFCSKKWDLTMNYYNSNNLNIDLEEINLPLLSRKINTTNFWNITS